jgi:hypothetical protein
MAAVLASGERVGVVRNTEDAGVPRCMGHSAGAAADAAGECRGIRPG